MAKPQTEHGYIRIANELLMALNKYRLSGEEWLILVSVLRKTYGYNKKEDTISLSQFEEMTGIARSSIVRAIKKLEEKNVIVKTKAKTNKYKINKNYDTWKPGHQNVTSKGSYQMVNKGVTKRLPKGVTKRLHTKDNIKDNNKDKIQKTHKSPYKKNTPPTEKNKPNDEQIEAICVRFKVSHEFVEQKWQRIIEYCRKNNKTYADYYLTLNNWVRRDLESVLLKGGGKKNVRRGIVGYTEKGN